MEVKMPDTKIQFQETLMTFTKRKHKFLISMILLAGSLIFIAFSLYLVVIYRINLFISVLCVLILMYFLWYFVKELIWHFRDIVFVINTHEKIIKTRISAEGYDSIVFLFRRISDVSESSWAPYFRWEIDVKVNYLNGICEINKIEKFASANNVLLILYILRKLNIEYSLEIE
ncbi:MAG: hypothetical protein F9K23_13010 [Bacteroidetes bacterium]|nr:MAG: hypothetical protein F9K23_13010 [Bacteroidota bacterium]